MDTRINLMLLCLLAGTAIAEMNTPARDYRVVNFDNGITSTLLEIGTTSVTFSVECAPDTTVPDKVVVLGKLNMDWDAWNFWGEMDVIQTQGLFIVEYPYEWVLPLEPNVTMFAQKAFFSLQIFISDEDWEATWGADGYGTNGVVSSPINAQFTETKEDRIMMVSSPNREDKLRMRNEELRIGEEELEVEKQETSNRLWLYLTILPCILAILYLMRKKRE